MNNLGMRINGSMGTIHLMMNDTSTDDEAMLWDETDKSNKSTITLENCNYPEVKVVYNRDTYDFILYSIDIDKLDSESHLEIIEGTKLIKLNKEDIYKSFNELVKTYDNFSFENKYLKVFDVPVLIIKLNDNISMRISAWLKQFGHRENHLQIKFIK